MSRDDAARTILAIIVGVAPEVGVEFVDDDADFVDELDLDSMDFLNVVIGVSERTGIAIPERDYDAIRRFGDFVSYLVSADAPSH